MKVHLIGIGGSGISAIARLLLESGYQVSGSDLQSTPLTEMLQREGAQVFIGHRSENLKSVDFVVRSSAVPEDNVEVQAARKAGIPVLKRSEYLGELMVGRLGIAVAGTHGKTTTSAMIAWLLTALDQDPSFIVGGEVKNLGVNAHAGMGKPFVIEADEYDFMFLGLQPDIAVVTNIEHDHPDFFPTPEDFYQAFVAFADRLKPDGYLLACADDPGAMRLLSDPVVSAINFRSYGLSRSAVYRATGIRAAHGEGSTFELFRDQTRLAEAQLPVPGHHNVQNAVAALGVIDLLNLPLEKASQELAQFRGTGRRFEVRGRVAGVTVIDDYAHHPTEIRATLDAGRARYPDQPLWAVWQPHTYSRTRTFQMEFSQAFAEADHVLVTEVFGAREPLSADYSSREIVLAMDHPDVQFVENVSQAAGFLLEHVQPGDVVLVLSAGDGDQISTRLVAGLSERRQHV